FGNPALAKQDVAAALALSPGRDVKVLAALVLGRVGDTAHAKALTDELEKNNPSNTVLKLYWLPTLRAVNELNSGNAAQAVVLLNIWKAPDADIPILKDAKAEYERLK